MALALAVATAGCGDASEAPEAGEPPAAQTQRESADRPPPRVEAPPCPAELADCVRASGEIVYVERVDPDGDGDAHFVLLSDESITGPGISVIDVPADLRPRPLPDPGDALGAAGPVHRGSFGQRQIEAVAVRFERGG